LLEFNKKVCSMTVKSHVLLSFMPLVVAVKKHILLLDDTEIAISAFIGTFIGAILPDIDEPNSYIGKRLKFVSKILKFFKLKHRTYTHSLFFPLLIFLLGKIHPVFYFISFGVFMHIIGDFLTNGGVPLFYPLYKKKLFLKLFKTGSILEFIIVCLISFSTLEYSLHY
jgi:inner membrane protein